MNLTFWVPPLTFRSGNDIISQKTAQLVNNAGIKANIQPLWPDKFARSYYYSVLPSIIEFRVYRYILHKYFLNTNLKKISTKREIAWIWANAAITDKKGYFEKRLKEKNKIVVFHFMDDWFSTGHSRHIIERAKYVDAYVVPTTRLRERLLEYLPNAYVQVLDEPINIDRFLPFTSSAIVNSKPVIVWTGSAHNFKKVSSHLNEILTLLSNEVEFIFRVISGSAKPDFNPSFEWEWMPFNYESEAAKLNGASIGIALTVNTGVYEECKGNYKVKTYLAAGIPVVASDYGINKHMIQDGINGYLFKEKEECVEKLKLILKDKILNNELSMRAKEYANEYISHEAVIPKWIEFICNLTKQVDTNKRATV